MSSYKESDILYVDAHQTTTKLPIVLNSRITMRFNILALAATLFATVRAAAVSAPAPVPSGDPELRNCDTRYLYCGSDLMSISTTPLLKF
jgi:hypothetical protein